MQRRMAVLGRALFVPVAIAVGALAVAVSAHLGGVASPSDGGTSAALMPLIGSGTHPVEATVDSWGVGNG
ncbi:hypothetical protein ACFQFC_07840 [Amorphoplanes digitatis]|uniref:Uncharacterized protein n=1 Tax=Actinoplanes digitatis TaxID=1868 RepID=A0A7W7I0D8_9ACTN|nr:hypothetical protein [Actinoplanes digitatis]MBB4764114.1 hypothetical protein [Actinoplanes digitatis]BFE73460.1 hypothetical protein GCM10020092_067610 [Actinoplanes digitatis]GID97392.1 hypothetical protein Adi01nite_68040 [Actinoplanes digitatis]